MPTLVVMLSLVLAFDVLYKLLAKGLSVYLLLLSTLF